MQSRRHKRRKTFHGQEVTVDSFILRNTKTKTIGMGNFVSHQINTFEVQYQYRPDMQLF